MVILFMPNFFFFFLFTSDEKRTKTAVADLQSLFFRSLPSLSCLCAYHAIECTNDSLFCATMILLLPACHACVCLFYSLCPPLSPFRCGPSRTSLLGKITTNPSLLPMSTPPPSHSTSWARSSVIGASPVLVALAVVISGLDC